jgi:hypothetical protein
MPTLRKVAKLIVSGAILVAASCHQDQIDNSGATPPDDSRYPQGPARPGPTIVSIEPLDLTTSVGLSPMQVVVSNWSAPVGAVRLSQIASSIHLKTWPELADVAVVASVVDATGNPGEDAYAHVHLAPSAQLNDRWYAISVDALPQGVTWPAFLPVSVQSTGARVSRFRMGSQPIVAGVRTYAKGAGKSVVYVDFSERITGDANQVAVSYADGTALNCVASPPQPPVTTATAGLTGKPVVPPGFSSVQMACGGPVDVGRQIGVAIGAGLSSTSGPALNSGAPVQIAIAPSAWMDWGDGGKIWKPSL